MNAPANQGQESYAFQAEVVHLAGTMIDHLGTIAKSGTREFLKAWRSVSPLRSTSALAPCGSDPVQWMSNRTREGM